MQLLSGLMSDKGISSLHAIIIIESGSLNDLCVHTNEHKIE